MVLKASFVELSTVQKRRKTSAPLPIYITLVACLFISLETLRREHRLATECFTSDALGTTIIPVKPTLQLLTSHAEHCSHDKAMIQNRPSPLSKKTKIPRSIHQFLHSKCVSSKVISSQQYPDGFGYYIHSATSMYHLVIHNEWPLFPMLKQVVLNCKILHLLAPYMVLWEYGGVWVDWNIEMTESLLEGMEKELVVMNTMNNWPSIVAMSPHHPYIRDVIQHILWASLGGNVDKVFLSTPSHSVSVEANFPLRYLEGRNSTFRSRNSVSCLSRVVGTDSSGALLESAATRQPPTTTTELLRLNTSSIRQSPATQTGRSGALVQSTAIRQPPATQTDSSGALSRSNTAAMLRSNAAAIRQPLATQTDNSGALLPSTAIRQPLATQTDNAGALSRSDTAAMLRSNTAAIQHPLATQTDSSGALLPSTVIRQPPATQMNSSGALLQSNPAPIKLPRNPTQTNNSGALLRLETDALWQPPPTQTNNSETLLRLETAALRQPSPTRTDNSGALLRLENAALSQPGPTQTENSGVLLQSGTSNATVRQPREAELVMEKQLWGAVQNATKHQPSYFSDQVRMEQMTSRMNVLTPYTGCSIAAFQYNLLQNPHPEFNDCFVHRGKEFGRSRGIRVDNAGILVKDGDTIYVQFNKLEHFVNMTMPHIKVDYVLMSGQEQKVGPFSKESFDSIIANPKVIHWFMMNMDIYSYDPHHPKISPWPYGANPKKMPDFTEELKKQLPEKNTFIHLTGFSRTTNPQRLNIPRGPKVHIKRYLSEMHASKYILSPDGDRPECYRHYEAIGMGTMPITQLDANTHAHLEGNAIFNNSMWNMTVLEATLPQNPQVNQRLIFEEYWMEYVERIVGRPLRWWDPSRDVRSSLAEITDIVAKSDTGNAKLPSLTVSAQP